MLFVADNDDHGMVNYCPVDINRWTAAASLSAQDIVALQNKLLRRGEHQRDRTVPLNNKCMAQHVAPKLASHAELMTHLNVTDIGDIIFQDSETKDRVCNIGCNIRYVITRITITVS